MGGLLLLFAFVSHGTIQKLFGKASRPSIDSWSPPWVFVANPPCRSGAPRADLEGGNGDGMLWPWLCVVVCD